MKERIEEAWNQFWSDWGAWIAVAVFGSLLLISITAIVGAATMSKTITEQCEAMCNAVDTHAEVATHEYGCLCENGIHLEPRNDD